MLKICLRSWRKIPKSDTSQKFHCYLNYIFSTMSDESTQQHSGRADLLLCPLLCLPDSRPEGQSIKRWCNSVRYCAASLSFIWPSKLLKCAHVFRPMAIYFYLLTVNFSRLDVIQQALGPHLTYRCHICICTTGMLRRHTKNQVVRKHYCKHSYCDLQLGFQIYFRTKPSTVCWLFGYSIVFVRDPHN